MSRRIIYDMKRMLARIDAMIDHAVNVPFTLLIILMMFAVLHVPLGLLTSSHLFSNERIASPVAEPHFWIGNILLYIHIGGSLPALLVGPFLFVKVLRDRHRVWHRRLGTLYVAGCLIGAVSVFPLALHNMAGPVAHVGFGSMAILWFTITVLAYIAARNKDFVAHRRWMMRSYAITFAFVHVNLTFELLLPYELFTGQGIQAFQSMVSWQSNLLIAEIYLAGTNAQGSYLGWKRFIRNLGSLSAQDRLYYAPRSSKG